jgi:N-acetylmuramoyl-L-alanine amidase
VNAPGSGLVNKTMNRRTFRHKASVGTRVLRRFSRTLTHGLPCVGLIVFLGHFSFIIAPDDNFVPLPEHPVAPAGSAAPVASGTSQIIPRILPGQGPATVVIDPGHGGIDDGTKYFGLAEKTATLEVARHLQQLLEAQKIKTVLTREQDVYVSLPERAEIANMVAGANNNVIFVSIHFNQSAVESVDGIETYYADKKIPPPMDWTWVGFFDRPEDEELDRGASLAADIQSALVPRMMTENRGIKSRSLFVTRHTRMPAVLVEGGFLSNKVENANLRNDAYVERIAEGIAAGIMTYIKTMHPAIPMKMAAAGTLARKD